MSVGVDLMPMTYEQALAYISGLEARGWRLGLDRMQEFVRRANLSDSVGAPGGPQFIHVAGTNGKGSTTAFLQSILFESGYRTGAFFSPFVVDPRERVQFGRNLISKDDLATVTAALIPFAETFSETEYGGITEFEFKTAVGLHFWKQMMCEWVALEVGLGGRLDATSVVTPRCSVIVSIGLDHTHILGNTHAQIAFEKAGIIKTGVPVIVGEMPKEAEEVIVDVALAHSAPCWRWGREVVWDEDDKAVETPLGRHTGLEPSLVGAIQKHNLSLAVAAIDASGAFHSEDALRSGTRLASIPGRFQTVEYRGRTVLLDGAHNPDSAQVLIRALESQFGKRKFVLVTNMLTGHEPADFYSILDGWIREAHVVPVDFHRATPVPVMAEKLRDFYPKVVEHDSAVMGLDAAIDSAAPNEIVLVTGTFYLVGEILRQLSADTACPQPP
ncbi:MAG: bifunctional folylpolyglutamate synthase/dihydrofolate synthase [Fimbriimonas sp.]|nr:bifunctional folylpolyglutamate synthase/dihydrofolate synthase [Fimbriimonas sp.]